VPPTRFAFFQEFATVDFISRGRAEIVAGRGSFVESYPLFGLSLEDHDSLFAEKLDLFLKIRASTQVHWSGKHRAALTLPSNLPSPVAGSATYLRRCRRHSRIFLYSYVAPAHAGKIILDAYERLRLWVRRRGNSAASTTLKIAVVAPMPTAIVRTAMAVTARRFAQHSQTVAGALPEVIPPEPAAGFVEAFFG
jgi:alkanesulfonate monooxygenase SsuD/methylene tetrahydromethanopterin reductase-like flavin-dependent oxidoreductase (luciferase family)